MTLVRAIAAPGAVAAPSGSGAAFGLAGVSTVSTGKAALLGRASPPRPSTH